MSKRDERHQKLMDAARQSLQEGSLPRPSARQESLGSLPVTELLRDTARRQTKELEDTRRELAEANRLLERRGGEDDADNVKRLLAQIVELEAAPAVQNIDPARIRHSRFRDRHELGFGDAAFKQLKADIKRGGQVTVPIKVRPVADDADADFEVVFGHRRHRACLELGLPVPCIIAQMSDHDVLLEMHRENAERKNLSAFEEAKKLDRMLTEGVFADQKAMGKALGISQSAASKLLSLASLPDEIVGFFRDPREITKHHGQQLRSALGKPVLLKQLRAAAKRGPLPARDLAAILNPAAESAASLEGHGTSGIQVVGHYNGAGMQLVIEKHLDQRQIDRLARFLEQL